MSPNPSILNSIGVVTTLYAEDWQADSRNIPERLNLLHHIVKAEPNLDILLLPAGTFVVAPNADLNQVARTLESQFPTPRPTICWGLDVRTSSGDSDGPQMARKLTGTPPAADDDRDPFLSFYALISPSQGSSPLWLAQQMAYRSTQAVADSNLPKNRVFSWGDVSVGVLICGELLASVHGRKRRVTRFRHITASANLLLDMAHADIAISGFVRWTAAMDDAVAYADGYRSLLIAQHLCVDSLERELPKFTSDGDVPKLFRGDVCHMRRTPVGRLTSRFPAALVDVYNLAKTSALGTLS